MAVAPDVVRGDRTLSPACEWRDQPVGSAADVFGKARSEREGKRAEEAARREHDDAVRKIGRLLTDAGLPTSRWKARDLMGRWGSSRRRPCRRCPGRRGSPRGSRTRRGAGPRSSPTRPGRSARPTCGWGPPHVPGRGHRLARPQHRRPEALGHDAGPRGVRAPGHARGHELRSGKRLRLRRARLAARGARDPSGHGRQGAVGRQRGDRAAVPRAQRRDADELVLRRLPGGREGNGIRMDSDFVSD